MFQFLWRLCGLKYALVAAGGSWKQWLIENDETTAQHLPRTISSWRFYDAAFVVKDVIIQWGDLKRYYSFVCIVRTQLFHTWVFLLDIQASEEHSAEDSRQKITARLSVLTRSPRSIVKGVRDLPGFAVFFDKRTNNPWVSEQRSKMTPS